MPGVPTNLYQTYAIIALLGNVEEPRPVSDLLRKLSPTRSPVLAIVLFVANLPFWFGFRYVWTHLLHADWAVVADVAAVGAVVVLLAAVVLYGLTRRFRTSTSRISVRLPRCVLIVYWIAVWVVAMLDLVRPHVPLPMAVDAGVAVVGLVALIMLVIGLAFPDDVADRRLRAGAPPLYRALAWAGALSGGLVTNAMEDDSLSMATGWALLFTCAGIFFLAYALDERWYRRQLLLAEDEPAPSAEQEETQATQ